MDLRKKFSWGSTKIFSFLFEKGINIKKGTIDGWIYRNKKPFEEVIINKIPKESKFLTEEKAYILGVLCGDGYIRISRSGYLIGLDVCDEDFANRFRYSLKYVYGLLPSKNIRLRKITNFTNNPKPVYVINLTSKLVVLDLLSYSKSFKTKDWGVPDQLKKSDLRIMSSFLKGFFDSEGTIRLKNKGHAYLQVCSGNRNSLFQIKNMLKRNFQIYMKVRYNQNGVMLLYTEKYENIRNFSNKIGFTIERKKEILDFCLSTYKRKGLRFYDKKFKLKVLNLMKEGYSAYSIGKILNFPYTNIYDFVKQAKRSGEIKDVCGSDGEVAFRVVEKGLEDVD